LAPKKGLGGTRDRLITVEHPGVRKGVGMVKKLLPKTGGIEGILQEKREKSERKPKEGGFLHYSVGKKNAVGRRGRRRRKNSKRVRPVKERDDTGRKKNTTYHRLRNQKGTMEGEET